MKVAIGIDIGGTNIQVALISKPGDVLSKEQLRVNSLPTEQLFFEALKQTIENMLVCAPDLEFGGIGVGSPGANIKTGIIENASNLPWNNLPVREFLNSEFQVPVHLTNDANLFAIGEKAFGQAKDLNDFVVITLGTGVGAGIYCNGSLLLGRDCLAGEIGHVVVQKDGRPCRCGRRGCLERYTSASGLILTVNELLEGKYGPTSTLYRLPKEELSPTQVVKAASLGDSVALASLQYTGQILGAALSDLAAYLNPECIFLAGGLSKAGSLLFEPTIQSFQENLLNIYPTPIPVLPGSIPDDKAGVLGAAALVWDVMGKSGKPKPSLIKIQ